MSFQPKYSSNSSAGEPFAAGTPGSAPSELDQLNRNYLTALPPVEPESTGGFLAKLKNRARRKISAIVRSSLLDRYVADQQLFNATTVRVLNEMHQTLQSGHRQLDDSVLAELISLERRLSAQFTQSDSERRRELGALAQQFAAQQAQLETLDSVGRGLERIVSHVQSRDVRPREEQVPSEQHNQSGSYASIGSDVSRPVDYTYLLLENRYRGSEETVAARLADYPQLFRTSSAADLDALPVLEIGAGRGELQTLFKQAGVSSYGIELDAAMVERCRAQGLDVSEQEGLAHLRQLPDRSLKGVVAIQVVEHLQLSQLKGLLELCGQKVAPGGKIVFETINTESIVALCQNYFRDPTHVWPMHPQTMQFLLELAGLKVLGIEKRSPYPEGARLQEIAAQDFMTPRWSAVLDSLNHNIRMLNGLLFDHQDYRIVAQVP